MNAKPIFMSESVTKAIADIQENHEAYIEGLDDLNEYILQSNTNDKEAINLLSTVCVMRRIVRQIKAGADARRVAGEDRE